MAQFIYIDNYSKTGKMAISLRVFEEIIVKSNTDGSNVRIKDIAEVELGAYSYDKIGLIGGKPASVIQVVPLPGANTIEVVNLVNKKITEINKTLPDSLEVKMMHDDSKFIRESMKEVFFTIILTSIQKKTSCILFYSLSNN